MCFMITDVRLSGEKSNKYLELHWKVSLEIGLENLILNGKRFSRLNEIMFVFNKAVKV